MPLRLPSHLWIALSLFGFVTGGVARADDKEDCVRAVERAQNQRLDGKLRDARDGFVTCARAVCPDAIRRDCTRWVTEVDASLPSVVFDAVWADGRDVTGMTVLLDGKPLAGAEHGRAVTLDPGEHTFRFEATQAMPVETHNVIREGEKNRVIHVTFTPVPPADGSPVTPPVGSTIPGPPGMWQLPVTQESGTGTAPVAPDRTRPTRAPVPLASYILGGVGLAGIAGFAALGLNGLSRLDGMRTTCGHTCNPSDVDSARSEILVGDVIGTVGLVAGGVALWLALARPSAAPSPPSIGSF